MSEYRANLVDVTTLVLPFLDVCDKHCLCQSNVQLFRLVSPSLSKAAPSFWTLFWDWFGSSRGSVRPATYSSQHWRERAGIGSQGSLGKVDTSEFWWRSAEVVEDEKSFTGTGSEETIEGVAPSEVSISDELIRQSGKEKDKWKSIQRLERKYRQIVIKKKKEIGQDKIQFWVEVVIPNWKTVKDSPYTRLVWNRDGLPSQLRGYIWKLKIGNKRKISSQIWRECRPSIDEVRKEIETATDVVESAGQVPKHSFGRGRRSSIRKDLFRMVVCGQAGNQIDHELLAHVLQLLEAFCNYRPSQGYVQGLTYIATMLLVYMSRRDAFICLANLLSRSYFTAYINMDASKILKRFEVFGTLFASNLPRLHSSFMQKGIIPDTFLMTWCVTLYCSVLDLSTCSRVWDGYFLHGELYMFKVAVGILSHYENRLQNMTSTECLRFLQRAMDVNEEELMNAVNKVHIPLSVRIYYNIGSKSSSS